MLDHRTHNSYSSFASARTRRILTLSLFGSAAILLVIFFSGDADFSSSGSYSSDKDGKPQQPPYCTCGTDLWEKWSHHMRSCLLAHLQAQSAWLSLHKSVEACMGIPMWRTLDVQVLENQDDVKFAILPSSHMKNAPCSLVTLGIGYDIASERRLKTLLPACKMYGADPSYEAGIVYESIGTYYGTAVADHGGLVESDVLDTDGAYRDKNVSTVSLLDFLVQNVGSKRIDYMFMDNEGAEYGLLPQLLTQGLLEQHGVSICQLSVELHGPLENYGMNSTAYDKLINDLISDSPFLPIWAAAPINHVRSFYVNMGHRYCLEKFFSLSPKNCS